MRPKFTRVGRAVHINLCDDSVSNVSVLVPDHIPTAYTNPAAIETETAVAVNLIHVTSAARLWLPLGSRL
ncbi:hypothetical protein ACFY2M_02420 [Streptomyces sp. NPDC001276]|uniref:hypothetical protein n=1 Tax=Streptomyces sp. NPDC001276 TaxID=3364555 RepID=UPI003698D0F3